MQSDCDDMRFTATDGSTLINYWIESGCNTNNTIVWVKVPSIPSGSSNIYMYYGNAAAATASSGDATFRLFDDFNDNSLNASKWVSGKYSSYTSVTESSGYARLYAGTYNAKLYAYLSSYNSYTYPMKIIYSVRAQANNIHGFAGTGVSQLCTYDSCSTMASESIRTNTAYGSPTFVVNGTSVNTQVLSANTWSRNTMNLKSGSSSLAIGSKPYQNNAIVSNAGNYLKFSVRKWFPAYSATYDYDYIALGSSAATEPGVSVGQEMDWN
jgi:hypothetical protein